MLDRVAGEPPGTVVVKIVASGQATSIAGLVGAATRVFRRRPPVVYAARRSSGQVRDLRFRSLVWTDLDALVSRRSWSGCGPPPTAWRPSTVPVDWSASADRPVVGP